MRRLNYLSLFLIFCSTSYTQITDAVAENVLGVYFQTINQDKLLQTNSYVIKGKMVVGQIEYPFSSYKKRPMKYRLESEIEGKKVITVVNGDSGWTVDPISGSAIPSPMNAEVFERSKQFAYYDGLFYNYKENGSRVEYVNDDYVGFIKTHVLKLTTKTGDIVTAFFNTQTDVLLKKKSRTLTQGETIEMEFYYSSYKFVNEILFPFTIEIKSDDDTVMKMLVEEIFFDENITDSMFEMPTSESQD